MELKAVFDAYAKAVPGKRTLLHSTSLALRRNGVDTIEKLTELYQQDPDSLTAMRDIGPRRLRLIGGLLNDYWSRRKVPEEASSEKEI